MKVLALAGMHGGVGRTASAVNVAFEATRSGARVLLWDLAPQGAATFLLRAEPGLEGGARALVSSRGRLAPHIRATTIPGLHVLPSDPSLRHLDRRLAAGDRPRRRVGALLRPLEAAYDLVVIDGPAGVTLATESILRASDVVLRPVRATPLEVRALGTFEGRIARRAGDTRLLTHVSMLDRCRRLQRDTAEHLRDHPGLLRSVVPDASEVERMAVERAPVATYAPDASAAAAYRALWGELIGQLWD